MHPCCGKSLRTGSYVVATVELIFSVVGAAFYILGLAAAGDYRNQIEIKRILQNFRVPFFNMEEEHTAEQIAASLRILFSVALVTCLMDVGLCLLLLSATKTENVKRLKLWIIIRLALLSLAVVYVFTVIICGYSSVGGFFSDMISVSVRTYFLWVVYAYWNQLKEEIALKMSPSIVKSQGKIDVTFPL